MRSRFLFLLSFVFSSVLPAAPLPSKYLDWVPSNSASFMVEPAAGLKTTGFTVAKPTFQNMNWNFNLADQWIKYLKDERDAQASLLLTQGNSITTISGNVTNLQGRMTTAESDIDAIQATAVLNPMDSLGDMIYGGASGVPTKLDGGTLGNVMVFGSTLPAWTSNLQILSSSGSVSSPNYAWNGTSSNTGFFLPSTDSVALSSNGVQSWSVDASGVNSIGVSGTASTQLINGNLAMNTASTQFVSRSGSVGAPGLSFASDLDSGIYSSALGVVDIANNGVNTVSSSTTGSVRIGPLVTNNYTGQRHIISGSLHAGNVTSADASGEMTFSANARFTGNAASSGRTDTVTAGMGIAVDNRTSAAASGLFIYSNQPGDATTTNAVTIASSTHAGAFTIGPPTSLVSPHKIRAANQVVLEIDRTDSSASTLMRYYGNGTTLAYMGPTASDAMQFYNGSLSLVGSIGSTGAVNYPSIHNIGSGNVTSGRYSPVISGGINLTSSTTQSCLYSRIGNIVTVSGYILVTPSSAALTRTSFSLTLPIASNLLTGTDAAGSGNYIASSGIASAPATITSDATNDKALFDFNATSTIASLVSFTFQYEVK